MTHLVWVSLNKKFFLEFLDDFSNVFMSKNEGGILDFLQNWKILDLALKKIKI